MPAATRPGVGTPGLRRGLPDASIGAPESLPQVEDLGERALARVEGVLVVEANPDAQWRLARKMTVAGKRVVGTSSGGGALALVARWEVDLVLVAEDLPGMDGLELTRRLQEHCPGVPIVLMTDGDKTDVRVSARLAGAAGCVRRPVTIEALRGVLADAERTAIADAEQAVALLDGDPEH